VLTGTQDLSVAAIAREVRGRMRRLDALAPCPILSEQEKWDATTQGTHLRLGPCLKAYVHIPRTHNCPHGVTPETPTVFHFWGVGDSAIQKTPIAHEHCICVLYDGSATPLQLQQILDLPHHWLGQSCPTLQAMKATSRASCQLVRGSGETCILCPRPPTTHVWAMRVKISVPIPRRSV